MATAKNEPGSLAGAMGDGMVSSTTNQCAARCCVIGCGGGFSKASTCSRTCLKSNAMSDIESRTPKEEPVRESRS